MEKLTPPHIHTKETNTTGYLVMIYNKDEYFVSVCCLCVSMFPYRSAIVQWARRRQRAHLIYFFIDCALGIFFFSIVATFGQGGEGYKLSSV